MTAAVVLWDVDGTLLTTARAGVFALEEALEEVAGVRADLQELVTSGLTDAEVAAAALRHAGVAPDDALVDRFLRAYERRLPECLHRRRGQVMPGVEDVLRDLSADPGVRLMLLTGNTPAGAQAKLRHYGLDHLFDEGAFCTGPGEREEIARRARELVHDVEAERLFVVGDTPADVRCGRAIGARTIGVATGSYTVAELAAAGAWHAVERVPEPPAFRALIGCSRALR